MRKLISVIIILLLFGGIIFVLAVSFEYKTTPEKKGDQLIHQLSQENVSIEKVAKEMTLIAPIPLVQERLEVAAASENEPLASHAEQILDIYEKSLSKDSKIAEKALDQFIKQGKTDLICISLKNWNLLIKKSAAEALKNAGDPSAVPAIIRELEENQGLLRPGGSEEQMLQGEVIRILVEALEKSTGQYYGSKELGPPEDIVDSPQVIDEIVKKSKKWWEENKEEVEG